MKSNSFFVVDTNVFISANLIQNSLSALAFDKILLDGKIALSTEVFNKYFKFCIEESLISI